MADLGESSLIRKPSDDDLNFLNQEGLTFLALFKAIRCEATRASFCALLGAVGAAQSMAPEKEKGPRQPDPAD